MDCALVPDWSERCPHGTRHTCDWTFWPCRWSKQFHGLRGGFCALILFGSPFLTDGVFAMAFLALNSSSINRLESSAFLVLVTNYSSQLHQSHLSHPTPNQPPYHPQSDPKNVFALPCSLCCRLSNCLLRGGHEPDSHECDHDRPSPVDLPVSSTRRVEGAHYRPPTRI